jgi:glycosyltransferase involved in cell wall biosynthesis
VVVPVYNEEATIHTILARVAALPLPLEVVVVDDASTDRTRELLEAVRPAENVKLIFKPQNEGKGAALRTGFAHATGDVVVIQDADLEYDPRDIVPLVQPLVEGRADVSYGSRFLGEVPQDPSLAHRMINGLLTYASNFFSGRCLTDMETCYKAFRRDVIRSIEIKQNRFGFEPEVTAKLARRGYRFTEVPIRYDARSYAEGKKIGPKDGFNALWCIIRYGLAD